jgi:hypothetical protein
MLTSMTDAYNATTASYDMFGRMVALVKPADSTTYPTVQAYYGDTELPCSRSALRRIEPDGAAIAAALQQRERNLVLAVHQPRREPVQARSSAGRLRATTPSTVSLWRCAMRPA